MDNDKQIPLKFLDEAEDCCDRIESTVLGLAQHIPNPQELDQALRAAHSVKGGAAMMGFIPLSRVAHQLEDFFKILRVRHQSQVVGTEVVTLLLQGVDGLRQVTNDHRHGQEIDENWLTTTLQPIFEHLRQHLGDLKAEDEDALLSQEGAINPAILMFESGVKESLDFLENQFIKLSPTQLRSELMAIAAELSDFGRMAKLNRFVELCRAVTEQSQIVDLAQVVSLSRQALKTWRKAHSLVLLGRFEKIPTQLPGLAVLSPLINSPQVTDQSPVVEEQPWDDQNVSMADDFNFNFDEIPSFLTINAELIDLEIPKFPEVFQEEDLNLSLDLSAEFSGLTDLEIPEFSAATDFEEENWNLPAEVSAELSELTNPEIPGFPVAEVFQEEDLNLSLDLSAEFSGLTDLEIPEFSSATDFEEENWNLPAEVSTELLELTDLEIPGFPVANISTLEDNQLSLAVSAELSELTDPEIPPVSLPLERDRQPPIIVVTNNSSSQTTTPSAANSPAAERQTVRVPVEYLQQFNTVFGQLILERNAINLRLEEIQSYTSLMRKRMQHLESSNQELRRWCDRSATENLSTRITNKPAPLTSTTPLPASPFGTVPAIADFDLLEMDRYNDLHLVSQDQIETIGQLQEVATDIELSLQEMTQSVRGLNQTTRILQKNIIKTQLLPFADVVKRFPRLIRDLSVQFGKSVNLQITGENIGIDRAILDNLSDPLMHLLRNAFDHGIEDVDTRLAVGKPAAGNIILAASQRGGETIITITDDGGGINLDRIRQRLQEMGLPDTEVSAMAESELLNIIFEPGFSTATSLTELSGRGVGMDVVRTNIEDVRGKIKVKTQLGAGTTFTISVPFALSILRVMLLERAGFVFAVAVDTVQEIIQFQPDLVSNDGTQITWQSQVLPLLKIEQGLNFGRSFRPVSLPGTATINQPSVLIVGVEQTTTAFQIDRFWGEQEVTLRSIDSPMPLTPGFGNSIILGDGRVLPLVDLWQFTNWLAIVADDQSKFIPQLPVFDQANFDHDAIISIASEPAVDTILVVDDSLNVRRYLAMMLEKEGYQVEQAKDGQEAVDKLLAGLVVQGVLCDIEMPRLDGYGVLDILRSDEDFENLPIVMLTSRSSEKHRQLALNLGASSYFTKPYTEEELLGKLKSLITEARENQALFN